MLTAEPAAAATAPVGKVGAREPAIVVEVAAAQAAADDDVPVAVLQPLGWQFSPHRPVFVPGCPNLLVAASGGTIRVYDTPTQTLVTRVECDAEVTAFACPDGSASKKPRVYVATAAGSLTCWCLMTSKPLNVWTFPKTIKSVFCRGEKVLALVLDALYVIDTEGSAERQLGVKRITNVRRPRLVAISPCGDYIASVSEHKLRFACIKDVAPAGVLWILVDLPVIPTSLAIHGTTVAVGESSGIIRLLDFLQTDRTKCPKKANVTTLKASDGMTSEKSVPLANSNQKHAIRKPLAQQPVSRILHWHQKPVLDLQFFSDGSTLLSGGSEGVLVLWNTESLVRTYVTRLMADIVKIALPSDLDGLTYALLANDNSVRIICCMRNRELGSVSGIRTPARPFELTDANPHDAKEAEAAHLLSGGGARPGKKSGGAKNWAARHKQYQLHKQEQLKQVLAVVSPYEEHEEKHYRPPILVHEPTRDVVVARSGQPGALQFIDCANPESITECLVTPNVHDSEIPAACVRLVAFSNVSCLSSHSSKESFEEDDLCFWMATVEERRKDTVLRFWRRSADPSAPCGYVPYARHSLPAPATCLAFRPTRQTSSISRAGMMAQMVITRADGEFNIWQTAEQESQNTAAQNSAAMLTKNTLWRFISGAGYRDRTPTACAWAHDGSVLAIAFGSCLTFWDPASLSMVKSTEIPFEITAIGFGRGASPLVAAVGVGRGLAVFNLLTYRVEWQLELGVRAYAISRTHIAVCVAPMQKRNTQKKKRQSPKQSAAHDDVAAAAANSSSSSDFKSEIALFRLDRPEPTALYSSRTSLRALLLREEKDCQDLAEKSGPAAQQFPQIIAMQEDGVLSTVVHDGIKNQLILGDKAGDDEAAEKETLGVRSRIQKLMLPQSIPNQTAGLALTLTLAAAGAEEEEEEEGDLEDIDEIEKKEILAAKKLAQCEKWSVRRQNAMTAAAMLEAPANALAGIEIMFDKIMSAFLESAPPVSVSQSSAFIS